MAKEYIGTYKVYRVFRKSGRRQTIEKDIDRETAMRITQSFPDSNTSMVVFDKQFTADKYYKEV